MTPSDHMIQGRWVVSSEGAKWKKLIVRVQLDLAPGALVEHDVRVPGRQSRTLRQVDVSVRGKVGQFELFIAIECKDHSEPVDVEDVGAFVAKVEDIGANRGVMVAAKGYTSAAKTLADSKGIDLLRVLDSGDHEWRTYGAIPVTVEFRYIWASSIKVMSSSAGYFAVPYNPEEAVMCDKYGAPVGSIGGG